MKKLLMTGMTIVALTTSGLAMAANGGPPATGGSVYYLWWCSHHPGKC